MQTNNEILLQIKIEGEQGIQTVKVTKDEVDKLIQSGELLETEFSKTYKELTQEALKYNAVSDQSADNLSQWIKQQAFSQDAIEKTIQDLLQQSKTLDINSQDWIQNQKAVENIRTAYNKVSIANKGMAKTTKPVIAGASQLNMTMGQLGYGIGDASMFMVDFRMGMMSIANNIPMVTNGLAMFRQEIVSTGGSVKKALVASLMGPGGLMIAINLAMVAMQILPKLFDDTTDSIEDQADEVEKLANKYEKLTKRQLDLKKSETETELSDLTKQFQEKYGWRGEFLDALPMGVGNLFGSFSEMSGDEQKQYEALINQKKALDDVASRLGYIKNLENELAFAREKRREIKDPEAIRAYDQLIQYYEDKLDKTKIEGNDKEKNKLRDERIDEFEAAQDFAYKMAELEELSDATLLEMKMGQLHDKIELYKEEGLKITELIYELTITEKEYANKMAALKQEADITDMVQAQLDSEKVEGTVVGDKVVDSPILGDWFDVDMYQLSAEKELDIWKAKEEEKLRLAGNTNEMLQSLDEEYNRRKARIDEARNRAMVLGIANTMGAVAILFNQNTVAFKALASAQTLISTYQAAIEAYKSTAAIPIVGPVIAPINAAAAIAFGLQQVASINNTEVPAYYYGGRLPEGQAGFVEGAHHELIAPEKTFVEIFKSELRPQIYGGGNGYGDADQSLVEETRDLLKTLNDEGVLAYTSEKEFRKLYNSNKKLDRKNR